MKVLTIEEKKRLEELFHKGEGYKKIAEIMGLSKGSVSGYAYRMKKSGGNLTAYDEKKREFNERHNKVGELISNGLSINKIASNLNLTKSQVEVSIDHLRQKGLLKRPIGKNSDHLAAAVANKAKLKDVDWPYIATNGVSLINLKQNQCHFPCQDGLYCGEEVSRRDYCAKHYAIVYVPEKKKAVNV
ncbi:gcra cell cycle regulator [Caudoviricetes sp.]|nr:gcra cell cycle regulator [Caudoviricetes sp.]